MPEEIIIRIKLRGSATLESPEVIEQMVRERVNTMIADSPILNLFIDRYTIEAQP